jgi:hypothetical protein
MNDLARNLDAELNYPATPAAAGNVVAQIANAGIGEGSTLAPAGRKPGARAWLPAEGLQLIKEAQSLGITESTSEKSALFETLVKNVATALNCPERAASAMSEHFKEMCTSIRTVASEYSKQKDKEDFVALPLSSLDSSAPEFIDQFKNYSRACYSWILVARDNDTTLLSKRLSFKAAWWDDASFYAVRLFIWKSDQKHKMAATASAEAQRSKFIQESEAKAQLAAEAKRKRDDEEKEDREGKRQLVINSNKVAAAIDRTAASLADLTAIMIIPPLQQTAPAAIDNQWKTTMEERMEALTGSMGRIEALLLAQNKNK